MSIVCMYMLKKPKKRKLSAKTARPTPSYERDLHEDALVGYPVHLLPRAHVLVVVHAG